MLFSLAHHLIFSVGIIFTLSTCAPATTLKPTRHQEWTSHKDSIVYKEIQDLYAKASYAATLNKVKFFESQFPSSSLLAQVKNIEGLTLLLTKHPLQAILPFKEAYQLNSNDSFRQFVLYNLATAQFEANELQDAGLTLAEITPSLLNKETRLKYEFLKSKLNQTTPKSDLIFTPEPDPNTVGVLLPLKGRYSPFGTRSLQGIELAFRIFNTDEPDNKITLAIEDSGETTEQALAALDKLFFQHKAIAILGPLLSKGIDQITQKAEALGIPIIPLSQQPGKPGSFVFPAALTPRLQAEEIAKYAIQRLGLHKFAILHPKDRQGEQLSHYFWDTVESMGGEITGIESYTAEETDFRHSVDKLSGLFYTTARQSELDALAEERKVNEIKKRNRKTEKFFSLKPIVNYEAVFIPDESKNIGQILPTFAYRDVENIKFLGTSTWNSPDLVSRAQNHAEGAVFIDVFYPEHDSPATKDFVFRHQKTFGTPPGSVEAIAFDAAGLLESALKNLSTRNRNTLREQLHLTTSYPGATGSISQSGGFFTRKLFIFTVKNGKITLAE